MSHAPARVRAAGNVTAGAELTACRRQCKKGMYVRKTTRRGTTIKELGAKRLSLLLIGFGIAFFLSTQQHLKQPVLRPNEANINCRVVIVAGVPLGDVGGGQRSAQLAYWFQRRLCEVQHLHLFKEAKRHTASVTKVTPLLTDFDLHFQNATAFFSSGRRTTLLLVEVPHESATSWVQAAQRGGIPTVVEIIDDWRDKSLGGDWYSPSTLQELCMHADLITVTAEALRALLTKELADRAVLVPNAASDWTFKPLAVSETVNEETPAIIKAENRSRYVIYVGSLYGPWFSWNHVTQVAKTCPETLVVLVGDASPEVRKLMKPLNNVLVTGTVQREALAPYIDNADAALIPFIPERLYDTISPVKLYEYVFSGKKVISTPSKTILGVPGVYSAESMRKFAKLACDPTIPNPSTPATVKFMLQNSWSRRVGTIMESLKPQDFIEQSVTVIVLSHNNADIIVTFLDSIASTIARVLRELTVVISDTGSTNDIQELVTESHGRYPFKIQVTFVTSGGASSGRQQAMEVRRNTFRSCIRLGSLDCINPDGFNHLWVFLDSDQFSASSSWLHEASTLLKVQRGRLGAVGWAAGWVFRRQNDKTVYWLPHRGENDEVQAGGVRTDIDYLGSGGLIVPGDVALACGGWDPQFDPHGYEDTDFSFAIRSKGYVLGYRRLAGIIHLAHSTTSKVKVNFTSASTHLEAQHKKFVRKWKHFLA